MKIIEGLVQGTPEWFAVRTGRATASCFADVLAKGEGKTRAKYLRQLIAERLTGKPAEQYRNAHMDRGNEQEPLARMAYELATDNVVRQVAFIEHDSLQAGCSPDGLILGQPKGVEIKSVLPHIQVETIMRGGHPPEHKGQIQGSMWITGYAEWDFCSYSPDFRDERLRTYIVTVQRDDAYIAELEAGVRAFLNDVDAAVGKLLERNPAPGAGLRRAA